MTDSTTLSSRQMAKLLKRITLHDNDIVLVKQSRFNEDEVMDVLRRGVERLGLGMVYVVIVEDFDDIKVLNHQEMNAHGWYHASQINKVTDRMRK
jgi:hypothetical protein